MITFLIILGYFILGLIVGIIFATCVKENDRFMIIGIAIIVWPIFILIFILFHIITIAVKISNKLIKFKQNGTKKF